MQHSRLNLPARKFFVKDLQRVTKKENHTGIANLSVWEASAINLYHEFSIVWVQGEVSNVIEVLLFCHLGISKCAQNIKPIFHEKPCSRWVANANEIDTNNMKSTYTTRTPSECAQIYLYSTLGLLRFALGS